MPRMRVIDGGITPEDRDRRPSAIRAAFEHFRLDRQANLVSRSTLRHYDDMIEPFVAWLGQTYPHLLRFEQRPSLPGGSTTLVRPASRLSPPGARTCPSPATSAGRLRSTWSLR